MTKAQDDKQQVGLTPEANEMIKSIAFKHFDGSEQDAYRFAIAYAVGAEFDPADAPGGQVTKFSALGTLESNGSIRDLLGILGVGDINRPFATAEKLAELGVRDIAKRLDENETLGEIAASVAKIVDSDER
ncbi:hypothetical protein [Pseudonocardia sp. 73-21]|uniref:hypothetical protein n=1 Tax=Pseudonocardia sp. 73-21 TaxID=1895809 RepID=UPI000961EFE1|nr:hypothetical protein [Pseudonocardia sp. 73-21]OJY42339.1 MAG: hypothetical protein BGP03_10365 [Pseudonocardia sp. 73-21]